MSQSPALQVKSIHKKFGDNEVLKGIDLTIHKGDVVSIIGSSGSGKSTFLRCINLLEIPTEGEIYVHGEAIKFTHSRRQGRIPSDPKQVQRIRAKLAMVFQNFNLWSHMTVMENIIQAPIHVLNQTRAEALEYAQELLNKVGLYERRDFYPSHLSGGQQQRAAIARALAVDPEVMLFDEPTSALDPELVGDVLKVMRDLADEGRSMAVVTHEMSFAREVSSQVMFLHQGQVEEHGSPDKVFLQPDSERMKQFLAPKY